MSSFFVLTELVGINPEAVLQMISELQLRTFPVSHLVGSVPWQRSESWVDGESRDTHGHSFKLRASLACYHDLLPH